MSSNPELEARFFYQQFPNLDKHYDSTTNNNPEWYELIDEDGNPKKPHRAEGGAVDAQPEMVKLSDHFN